MDPAGYARDAAAFAKEATTAIKECKKYSHDGVSRFRALKDTLDAPEARRLQSALLVPQTYEPGIYPSMLNSIAIVEEVATVDASLALVLSGGTLGMIPISHSGSNQTLREVYNHFDTNGRNGGDRPPPLACLALSEPGGTANAFEPGAPGFQTTAEYDAETEKWLINGEKIWSTSIAGWHGTDASSQAADFIILACRQTSLNTDQKPSSSPRDSLILFLIQSHDLTPSTFTILSHPITPGLTLTSGSHVRFTNASIPLTSEIARGASAALALAEVSKRGSVLVAAASLGVMRHAFNIALDFARTQGRSGPHGRKIIEIDSAKTLLAKMKMRLATSRAMVERAVRLVDGNGEGAMETALQAKIWASEEAGKCVLEASRLVGVSSYDMRTSELGEVMADAMAMPLIGGGNEMVRKRLAGLAVE